METANSDRKQSEWRSDVDIALAEVLGVAVEVLRDPAQVENLEFRTMQGGAARQDGKV